METLLFPLLILVLFIPIFLSGRKQRRQVQEMKQLQASLEPGDVVTTTSGLRGTVVDTSYEDTIDLEIADGVVTTWIRAAVRDKLDTTPDDASSLTGIEPPAAPAAPAVETDPAPGTGTSSANGSANGTAGASDDDAQTGGTPGSRN
jgi:preprotein translocase subunit YajC